MDAYVCFCCVCFSFQYEAKRLAGKNVSEMTYFGRVGRKTLTESVSQLFVKPYKNVLLRKPMVLK